MKKILFAICGVLLLCSCNKSLLDEERTFDHNVWNRFTPEVFEVSIDHIDDYYNIDVTAVIDTAVYRYLTVPMLFNLYSPAGDQRSFYAEVPFTENGRWRGEMLTGDKKSPLRTASRRIRAFFSVNSTGTHRMEIGQTTSQYDLEGIHSIHVTISKAQLDYDMDK